MIKLIMLKKFSASNDVYGSLKLSDHAKLFLALLYLVIIHMLAIAGFVSIIYYNTYEGIIYP